MGGGRTLVIAMSIATTPRLADAAPRVTAGAIGGVTLGPSEYFPTFLGGLTGDIGVPVAPHVSVGLSARIQVYSHREEEDFGSWGGQQDISVTAWLALFDDGSESR